MKCCLCNKESKAFLKGTDLCKCCSSSLANKREEKNIQGYKPENFNSEGIYKEYPRGDFYVYRFLEGEDTLYIGKSTSLAYRVCSHITTSRFNYLADKVDVIKFNSEIDMGVWELYLINKYRPPFNKYRPEGSCSLTLTENWESSQKINSILSNTTFSKILKEV